MTGLVLLWMLEALVGKPPTVADWHVRWKMRNDLPLVSDLWSIPSDLWHAEQQEKAWDKVVAALSKDVLTTDVEVEYARRQARAWMYARQLYQGWGDSWDKRMKLYELFSLIEEKK